MNNPVISVKNISKCYEIYKKPIDRLKQALYRGKKEFFQSVWALRKISFDINKGSVIGVIGSNGAGKTTLLQILSGIIEPTEGEVKIKGSVFNLLELGSGLNYDFTGRENILHYGLILGQSKEKIELNMSKIIEFADIGMFIDQPVKTYSNGMVLRLAFSVLTICDNDILLIDEIISVGDIGFQMKCLRWMENFMKKGGTVCIVSHDINFIANKCDRVILLKNGCLDSFGSPLDITSKFRYDKQQEIEFSSDENKLAKSVNENKKAHIKNVVINQVAIGTDVFINQNESIKVEIDAVFFEVFEKYSFGFSILSSNGVDIFSISSRLTDQEHPHLNLGKPIKCVIDVIPNLRPGNYYIQVGIGNQLSKQNAEFLDVIDVLTKLNVSGLSQTHGFVDFPYKVSFS